MVRLLGLVSFSLVASVHAAEEGEKISAEALSFWEKEAK
ncbi:uncharacterized protein METZ01_LOCUS249668, partial [marine metagenome]